MLLQLRENVTFRPKDSDRLSRALPELLPQASGSESRQSDRTTEGKVVEGLSGTRLPNHSSG